MRASGFLCFKMPLLLKANILNVNKYNNKTVAQLKKIAVAHFHKWIRARDKSQPCISCGKYTTLQAGHYFSAGLHPLLKFEEDNVNGQCIQCNYFNHGNESMYSISLKLKLGTERFERLNLKHAIGKRSRFKWDRFSLIDIIEKYKKLNNS